MLTVDKKPEWSHILEYHARRQRVKRIFAATFKIAAAAFLLLMAAGIVFFILLINQTKWKSFDPARLENQAQTLIFYDRDDKAVGGMYGAQNRVLIKLSDVPETVQKAFLSAEDERFYIHPGVDIRRILGALWADITHWKKVQGASTLTQQLVKNTHLTNEKTWSRKLQEARLALQIEQVYSKDEIFEMYLNTVYFGNGAYGIEAASQAYFGKRTGDLTTAEGALLAGVLKGPGIYAPHIHMDKSVERRNLVLSLMNKYGFLTEEDMKAAQDEPVTLNMRPRLDTAYGFYLDAAEREAEGITGLEYDDLVSGGYKVYTTLDRELQGKCDALMADKDMFPPDAADGEPVQGGLIVLDSRTGGVRAVTGGRAYVTKQGLNRATSSRRQPGSAIKPVLVYGPAMDRFGYNAATMIQDAPADFSGYKPQNAGGGYSGWVTVRQAIVRSINVPAVQVLNDIGIGSAKDFAQRNGIKFNASDTSLPIALGGFTEGVTPMELAGAYTAFANAGRHSQATFVRRIEDADGSVIYENRYTATPVMSDATAFIMTDILHNAAMSGTARLLNFTEIPLAAKTGTVAWSRGNKDVWLASYNPDYVVVCWQGFDRTDNAHHLSSNVTGGTFPAQVCKEVFKFLYRKTAAPRFQMPDSVTLLALDNYALQSTRQILLASPMTPEEQKIYEYFPKTQAPTQVSTYWQTPMTPTGFSVTLSERGYPVVAFTVMQDFVRYDIFRVDSRGSTAEVRQIHGAVNDTATYEDYFVQPGVYSYYVSPVHPELNVTGSPTDMLQVTVPGTAETAAPTEPPSTGFPFSILPWITVPEATGTEPAWP